MFSLSLSVSPSFIAISILAIGLVIWIGRYGSREWKRRGEQALLAHVVDNFVLDRVRNDISHFERDRSRVVKKAWKFTDWSRGGKQKSPEPYFEALLDGATNKCFKVTYGGNNGYDDVKEVGSMDGMADIEEVDIERKTEKRKKLSNSNFHSFVLDGRSEGWWLVKKDWILNVKRIWSKVVYEMWRRRGVRKEGKFGFLFPSFSSSNSCESFKDPKMAFMRVQGAGSVLSNPREQEMAIFQYAAKEGLGARLYAVFENGYVAEYVKGRVVKVEEMRDEEMMNRIGKLVSKWHSLSCPSSISCPRLFPIKGRKPFKTMSLEANTFDIIDKWLLRAKRLFSNEDALSLSLNLPPTFQAFSKELSIVKNDILPFYALPHASKVLCHNDLNHGNLLFFSPPSSSSSSSSSSSNETESQSSSSTEKQNLNSSSLSALDLEFSGINHRGFDLGNHFCEWAGLELKYDQYLPSDNQIKLWLFFYLSHLNPSSSGFCYCTSCYQIDQKLLPLVLGGRFDISLIHSPIPGFSMPSFPNSNLYPNTHIPMTQIIEEMLIESRKWMQVSHLFWWLWGMIQTKISNVEGFNAKNYCEVRWKEYMKHKTATLNLPHPPRLLSSCPPFKTIFSSHSPQIPSFDIEDHSTTHLHSSQTSYRDYQSPTHQTNNKTQQNQSQTYLSSSESQSESDSSLYRREKKERKSKTSFGALSPSMASKRRSNASSTTVQK